MSCRVVFSSLALLAAAVASAGAQIIAVKTSPLAEGDQATFLPSANRGMAGVSIAVRDTLLDPFSSPATGLRLRHSYAFGTPSFYSLTHNGSTGSTIPLGVVKRGRNFFVSTAVAMQVIEPSDREAPSVVNPVVLEAATTVLAPGASVPHTRRNGYLFASGGRTLRDSTFAVGASLAWSRIGGVDGVDLLYPGNFSVREHGDNVDLRVGATKDWARRSIEGTVLHTRSATTHDISYVDLLWDPGTRTVLQRSRADHNYDQRHRWGAHVRYTQALGGDSLAGWKIGALLTANRTTQPTAPVLGMMTPAGDPGRSTALNAGVGIARTVGRTSAGVDAIYEPITAERVQSGAAVEHYRFGNAIVRGGVAREFELTPNVTFLRLQAGAEWHRISYAVREGGTPAATSPTRWNQWTHTFGAGMRSSQFEFQYAFRILSGVQRPGFDSVQPPIGILATADAFPAFGPRLRMMPVRVVTQQFTFSMRIP